MVGRFSVVTERSEAGGTGLSFMGMDRDSLSRRQVATAAGQNVNTYCKNDDSSYSNGRSANRVPQGYRY